MIFVRAVLAPCILVLLVSGTLAVVGCNPPNRLTAMNETNMSQEEITKLNAETIEAHLRDIEFTPTRWELSSTAYTAAACLSNVTDRAITTVSSEQTGEGLQLTLKDSEGQIFKIGVGKSGSTGTVYDEEGTILYVLAM